MLALLLLIANVGFVVYGIFAGFSPWLIAFSSFAAGWLARYLRELVP